MLLPYNLSQKMSNCPFFLVEWVKIVYAILKEVVVMYRKKSFISLSLSLMLAMGSLAAEPFFPIQGMYSSSIGKIHDKHPRTEN